jgi:hypothetical protein
MGRTGYDLESDIKSTDWLVEKIKNNKIYAQHVYAALCENEWRFGSTSEMWLVHWREAGKIISEVREEGSYLDWYCSGVIWNNEGNVREGLVTEEVREDLNKIGWILYEVEL